jgi:hypothetical protein
MILTPSVLGFSRMREATKAPLEFGLIPREHWVQPRWINETLASINRDKYKEMGTIYGGESYYPPQSDHLLSLI